jgi:Flp pilus assembly protein TadG
MLYRREYICRPARRGAALAELVVVLTTLVFILVACTDFARVFYSYLTITNCARNGALYGCTSTQHSTDTAGIQAAALTDTSSLSPTPGVSSTTGTDASGNPYVAVTVTYTFTTLITYPGINHTMNLTRTVQMRVAQGQPN